MDDEKPRADELEWLRYFYGEADFGPADEDVRSMIKDSFIEKTGKLPPIGYAGQD